MSALESYRASLYRGGTSRGVFLTKQTVQCLSQAQLEDLAVRIIGSPERRQIDGMGGGDASASKVVVVGSGDDENTATYEFLHVMHAEPRVDASTICGSLSAAAAAFAIDEGLVPLRPGADSPSSVRPVTLWSPATGRSIYVDVPVDGDGVRYDGDLSIPGILRKGSRFTVDWRDFQGSITGKLLPTGSVQDQIEVPGVGTIAFSVVDLGNVGLYCYADQFGIKPSADPSELDNNQELKGTLEHVRGAIGRELGLPEWVRSDAAEQPINPVMVLVGRPEDRVNWQTGEPIPAMAMDVSCIEYMWRFHKVLSGSIIAATAAAVVLEGTVANDCRVQPNASHRVRIGVPSGVIPVESEPDFDGGLRTVKMVRTARPIMKGVVYA